MPKDLLTHVLNSLPLETISMFILKNALKKKLFEKIRKIKSCTSLTLSQIVSWSKYAKEINKNKII